MPLQRRIQWMRAQKMGEEAIEKERDDHFNTIRPVIPMNQEWRVKEKSNTPAPTTSDDNMDLLDDDESLLIKDGSPPLIDLDINMVCALPVEFNGVEEEVVQMCLGLKEVEEFVSMCLGLKEVVFKKHEESSQHLRLLYVQGHIDGRPISRMLIDGGTTVNLMLYSIFKKLGRDDDS
jgi:hypothetical protein